MNTLVFLKQYAANLLWPDPEKPQGRPNLTACEYRRVGRDGMIKKRLTNLPLDETPSDYGMYAASYFYIRYKYPRNDTEYQYVFYPDEQPCFPVRTLDTVPNLSIVLGYLWCAGSPPVDVTQTLHQWAGPDKCFHKHHSIPALHIWPTTDYTCCLLYLMLSNGQYRKLRLVQKTKISCPIGDNVASDEFQLVQYLHRLTPTQFQNYFMNS
jgi:hypothetical protein